MCKGYIYFSTEELYWHRFNTHDGKAPIGKGIYISLSQIEHIDDWYFEDEAEGSNNPPFKPFAKIITTKNSYIVKISMDQLMDRISKAI